MLCPDVGDDSEGSVGITRAASNGLLESRTRSQLTCHQRVFYLAPIDARSLSNWLWIELRNRPLRALLDIASICESFGNQVLRREANPVP